MHDPLLRMLSQGIDGTFSTGSLQVLHLFFMSMALCLHRRLPTIVAGEMPTGGAAVTGSWVMRVERQTVDLTAYPDLVVIYLGMRVRRPRGALRLFGLGPQIQKSWKTKPDGLLLHEDLVWSLVPLHLGMRQYWRDLDSLERWTRSDPHRRWWQQFLKDSGGTGFWHEAYFMRGGVDAIYDDMDKPTGIARFAPATPARGAKFSARHRAGQDGQAPAEPPVIPEQAYYDLADRSGAQSPGHTPAD